MSRIKSPPSGLDRRAFLRGLGAVSATVGLGCRGSGGTIAGDGQKTGPSGPAVITSDRGRPVVRFGVQSGDIAHDRAVLWAATDRPARALIEWSTTESFADVRRVVGPAALADSAFCAKLRVGDLPADQHIFYRVLFEDLGDLKTLSEPIVGHFRTAPRPGGTGGARRSIRFLWSGDTAGQGWGIDRDRGGMTIYRTMREREPDFFIHSGDTIYADGPIPAEVAMPGGGVWRNVVLEGTHKVAETLDEFRANYQYNLMDEHVRAFNARVPQLVQWDDHETVNNWYPTESLDGDGRYTVKSVALLSARAKRAFMEWTPMAAPVGLGDPERIYRTISYGPLLDVFMLDMRSYRGPNSTNRQAAAGPDTAFLGSAQLAWLQDALAASKARWKVIASDMPLGLVVDDGPEHFENCANGNGPARGRELEIAALLRSMKQNKVRNVVWLTADVHYTAAHYYDPGKAQFTDFEPFWEFVSGPLHAGTFGPAALDDTFGPQVVFQRAPGLDRQNLPPSAGMQFFGEVAIDGQSEAMTVILRDVAGTALYTVEIPAKA